MVSVVVTTYNHEMYIERCLEAILAQQTKFPFDIIIGEDDSTDNTREICKRYATKYPEKIDLHLRSRADVIYINGNPSGRFNFMSNLKAAKQKYLALCEGDDYWTDPQKLQKQVDFMESNPDYGICFHNVNLYMQPEKSLQKDTITLSVPETTTIADLAKMNYIHTPSVLLCNDFKLPEWYTMVSLGDWVLYMCTIGQRKIKKLDDVMAVYRIHNNSLWSSKDKDFRVSRTQRDLQILIEKAEFLDASIKRILKNRLRHNLNKKPRDYRGKYWFKKVIQRLKISKS